jgi:hypothetical protein
MVLIIVITIAIRPVSNIVVVVLIAVVQLYGITRSRPRTVPSTRSSSLDTSVYGSTADMRGTAVCRTSDLDGAIALAITSPTASISSKSLLAFGPCPTTSPKVTTAMGLQ